ncbi:MAG TPA: bifunctional methylenetetrahydrofolate dehydrogenase/methenyltetrahydrofolate cyclohydrolase FolD [Candidatus Desulfofervidus auxilii]|uniref:Bifunctional protein FolD n=1 Tax=Desulfofervidus auxilii TaxID=1621989 RepID=A0A7C0U3I9_DESA2|nr:bifunctional methylenetetrahydrofolate dehydrogenase/methenyltetrahydrofolate cyclohydrolase FolD [Candidatus Desulfofervidus auxilii]
MAIIISGKEIASKIRQELAEEIESLKIKIKRAPCLAVIWVGEHPASASYIRAKEKACKEIGIEFELYHLSEDTSQEELCELIKQLNHKETVDAFLVQLPLPPSISERAIIETINPEKDADGFHPYNLGRLLIGEPSFIPCTPAGIWELLCRAGIETRGKEVVILGRSNIVGKPLAALLMQKNTGNATVTVCHTATKDLLFHTLRADILIVAIGKPRFIKQNMVKKGTIVIDVGIHRTEKGLCGDVDFEDVSSKVAAITPVPGGVGPMTVAMLLKNTLLAYKKRYGLM